MEKATEIFEKHWNKATGKPLDETTKHHMKYAIEAINEALLLGAVSCSLPTQDEISKAFEHRIKLGSNISKWTRMPEDTPAQYALKMLWFMDGVQFIYDKIKGNDR